MRRGKLQAGEKSKPCFHTPEIYGAPRSKGKLFFVSFADRPRHNRAVTIAIGAFLNALGILLGALYGLAARRPLTLRTQEFFKTALGTFTVFYGLRLVYENVHGPFTACLKEIFLTAVAVVLGNWLGRLLRVQQISNRIGHYAATRLATAQKTPPGQAAGGFSAATILFCAAPLGLLGTVADGLENYFYLLLLKGVMDGLAMLSFVKMFRWPAALAAVPVFLFLNGLTLLVRLGALPWLDAHFLTESVNRAAGLIACIVALVIFQVRRVELNGYLPALVVAPLLTWWLG